VEEVVSMFNDEIETWGGGGVGGERGVGLSRMLASSAMEIGLSSGDMDPCAQKEMESLQAEPWPAGDLGIKMKSAIMILL